MVGSPFNDDADCGGTGRLSSMCTFATQTGATYFIQVMAWSDATPAVAEELIAYCREHLSQIKCPRSIDFERELPRHPTGKLYKRLIRDRYWGNHASKIV